MLQEVFKIAELEFWCVSMCNHLHSSFFARMIMISDLNSRYNDVWFFLCGRLQASWFLLIDVCSRWQDRECPPTKKPNPGQNLIFRISSNIDWAHMINCPDSWIMGCTEWVWSVYQLRRKGKKSERVRSICLMHPDRWRTILILTITTLNGEKVLKIFLSIYW